MAYQLRRRGSRLRPDQPGRATSLVASAARITIGGRASTAGGKSGKRAWQGDTWRYYDECGELAYAAGWVANSLSRVKLFVAKGDTDVPEPERVAAGDAVDFLAALFNGPAGQSEMLRQCGLHLTVPGELYLAGYTDADGAEQWVTASIDEVKLGGSDGSKQLDRGGGDKRTLTKDDTLLRMWRSHPRRHWEPDSPTRHVLPVLVELEALNKGVLNAIDSRLAGNGVLLLPDELSFPDAANPELHSDPFMATLIEAMTTPLNDRESAASVVPLIARGPAEVIDKAKWLSFARDLDKQTGVLREAALNRLALGLDTPPEVLKGFGQSNHWTAWQISEEAVKLTIEPLCATICDALTTGYLWPLLGAGDHDETIWFDTSALTQRPDRAPDAQAVYDVGELSAVALRRERGGFGEEDAPNDAERLQRLLIEIVKNRPELAEQLLPLTGLLPAGVVIIAPATAPALPPGQQDDGGTGDGGGGDNGPPDDSRGDGPPEGDAALLAAGQLPGDARVFSASLLIAADVAVHRALEIAGKRMRDRNLRAEFLTVPPYELHTHVTVAAGRCDALLVEAWSATLAGAPELEYLVPALDDYVRTLLTRGVAHERRWLADVLRKAVSDRAAVAVTA